MGLLLLALLPALAVAQDAKSSYSEADPVFITLHNSFEKNLEVFWRNPKTGGLTRQEDVPAKGENRMRMHHSHVFLGYVDGAIKMHLKADRAKGENQGVRISDDMTVTFKNEHDSILTLFWRHRDTSEEVNVGVIEAGKSLDMNTKIGDKFIVKNTSGRKIKEWEAQLNDPDAQVVHLSGSMEL
jgi:hypothetical protein